MTRGTGPDQPAPSHDPTTDDPVVRPDSREALLTAARQLFAENGYERTTMRAIAARVGVDAALIYHYFPGGKQALLAETLTLPLHLADLMSGVGSPADRAGRSIVSQALSVWDEHPEVRDQGVALLRIAVANERAGDLLRPVLRAFVDRMIGDALRADDRELRAGLVLAQMQGMLLHRYVLLLEPLATAAPQDIIDTLGPVLQHYITGDLRGAAPSAQG